MTPKENLRYSYTGSVLSPDFRLSNENGISISPCERVSNPDLLVGILGNNKFNHMRLLVAHRDRLPIKITDETTGQRFQLNYPGKSAFFYFYDQPDKNILSQVVEEQLQRLKDRGDHLHLSTVGWVEEAGWQVWWAPLPESNNWLHVRLVPNSIIEYNQDPTEDEAMALKEVFVRAI